MTADITLINLNLLYVKYFDLVDKELHVPLGCLYLTRALEDAGFSVDFRDYQRNMFDEPFEIENMLEFVRDPAPIIGFSCMANLLPFVLLSMRAVKARYPDRFLVLGGVGAKAVEEQIMERFPWIDAIAVGEGEVTGPALVGALKSGADLTSVAGLVVRTPAGTIVRTSLRPRITDLDAIPLPAFEKIDLAAYRGYGLMSSRGCPYPCTFCSVAPVWDRTSTYRSNAGILAEMRHLHEKAGVELFLFQDEFFVCNKPKVMEFCAAIKQSGPRVYWKAFGRVDLTDHEMMTAMAEAGCVELRFGIESGSDRVLNLVKKGFTAEQAVATVAEAVKVFPRVDAFYMWGFPFETMDDFHQTVFQMLTLRMMGARILPSLLCLLPQTDLYRDERVNYPLDFCPDLFPEYMITGHEVSTMARFRIEPRHQAKYEFIQAHPDLFPGFFHLDLEGNVRPKLAVLKKFGFYPEDREAPDTESCGAHSPRIPVAPGAAAGANLATRLDG
jgi:anaerobic magnesium-protoporphyrin IX monomethyl ester cyclase